MNEEIVIQKKVIIKSLILFSICGIGLFATDLGLFSQYSTMESPRSFYVDAKRGDDSADGSEKKPFRTIQKAVDFAKPGDSCIIGPGVYRETVTPNKSGIKGSPITLQASVKNTVTIIGTDPVNGWSRHSSNIYKVKMDWSLGKNNQLFFDNHPLQEARWPNDKDDDPMTPDGVAIDGGSVDHILSSKFPTNWKPEDLKGAVVWAIVDRAWSSWTSTISDYDPERKAIYFPSFKGDWWVETRHNPVSKEGSFYLVGALTLLDQPGEWFYDEAERELYLWAPDNVNPAKHQVEAKARSLGINLQGRSWITIDGINLQACSVDMDSASHCLVKNIKAYHISHTRGGKTTKTIDGKSGIYLSGHHNQLVNCEIAYSAGNGVLLSGADNAVVNCWIHHINYMGAYCSPIRMEGMRHLVSHNTIAYAGRDGLKPGGAEHLIQFNDIGFSGRICHDLGIIYTGGMDGGNTRIRYNYCHDNPGAISNVGIYLDNYMKNYIIDHNVIWNVGNGIRLNRPTSFCMILNNTVFSDITNNWGPWKGQQVQWGSHVMNNLYMDDLRMNSEVVVRNNMLMPDFPPDYFDIATRTWGNLNAGKTKGIPITGITPNENVDAGAIQSNEESWQVGHNFEVIPEVNYTPATEPLRNHVRNASFEYGRYNENTHEPVSPLIYWNKTGSSDATVSYHKGFNSPPANERNSVHANSLALDGDGDNGVKQRITTLEPNTEYTFSGYTKYEGDINVEFSIQNPQGVVVTKSSQDVVLKKGQTWRLVYGTFKTGSDDTSVNIIISKRGKGVAYVDDTGIIPINYYGELQKE